jgi:hypothetical protein
MRLRKSTIAPIRQAVNQKIEEVFGFMKLSTDHMDAVVD